MIINTLFENDDYLVVDKPSGLPTHAPDPKISGLVEILSEQKKIKLGVHQRLDAATSGVIIFSKSPTGSQKLAKSFELRNIQKKYLAIVCGHPKSNSGKWSHHLEHIDGKTIESPKGKFAQSRFYVIKKIGPFALIEFDLLTGITHQLRVQSALAGFPILGDPIYGGGDLADRMWLHAQSLRITSEPNLPTFNSHTPQILSRPSLQSIIEPILLNASKKLDQLPPTEAIRILSPQHSGIPEIILEKLGQTLLIRHLEPEEESLWSVKSLQEFINTAMKILHCDQFSYKVHKTASKSNLCAPFEKALRTDPVSFIVTENNIQFHINTEGNAVGLYLDQRDNRSWVTQNAHGNVLNLFAYTCAFSICAAKSTNVTSTTSIDAAPAALKQGKQNFELNHISSDGHRFIIEDTFKYLKKCIKNNVRFDTIICDPPSFGRFNKTVFSLDDDLEELILLCLSVAAPKATILFSINHRKIRLPRLKTAWKNALQKLKLNTSSQEIFINDDATGPLGVGTDLKTIRAKLK